MNKLLRLCLATSVLALPAHAEWSSGGGKISKDAGNPWFINNTTEVLYCLQTDAAHVSLPHARLAAAVTGALAHWRAVFAELNAPRQSWPIRVGEQRFVEVDCSAPHAVSFQFGVLSDEQRQHLTDPASIVGIAVRTDYDTQTMRARGFVYIAADSGPLKPSIGHLADGFWSQADGVKLDRVLLHEIGHIFGVPHRGSAKEIMGEGFPERVVGETDDFELRRPLEPFFNEDGKIDYEMCGMAPTCPEGEGEGCGWWMPVRRYFAMPDDLQCLHIVGTRFGLQIEGRADRDAAEYRQLGRVSVSMSSTLGSDLDEVIRVFIPEGQTADTFPAQVRPNTYYNAVNRSTQIRITGEMTLSGQSERKSVSIDVNPRVFEWLGIVDGKIDSVVTGGIQDRW